MFIHNHFVFRDQYYCSTLPLKLCTNYSIGNLWAKAQKYHETCIITNNSHDETWSSNKSIDETQLSDKIIVMGLFLFRITSFIFIKQNFS